MSETARLKLPFLAPAQAQKHVTVNEAIGRLDALVQSAVLSRQISVPPVGAGEGAAYIVPAGGAGDWTGGEGRIAQRLAGDWVLHEPENGWLVFVADEGRMVLRAGGEWRDLAEAAVFHPAGSGFQLKLNKPAPVDTASVIFQTGWSGRAEIGLAGDDDLALKVSPDGTAWIEAMRVDRTNGRASFPSGALRSETFVFTAPGSFTLPAWARSVEIVAIGAGGAGGSGRRRAFAVERRGGGGGSPGAFTHLRLPASELPAVMAVDVGAGGAGGGAATADDTDGTTGGAGGISGVRDGADYIIHARGGNGGVGGRVSSVPGGAGVLGCYGIGPSGATGAFSGIAAAESTIGFVPGAGGGGSGVNGNIAASYPGGAGSAGSFVAGPGNRAAPGGAGGGPAQSGLPGASRGFVGGCGGGGGGGGSGTPDGTAAGGHGGDGGAPGGGGGGGGGSTNGSPSGSGGNGARGEVVFFVTG